MSGCFVRHVFVMSCLCVFESLFRNSSLPLAIGVRRAFPFAGQQYILIMNPDHYPEEEELFLYQILATKFFEAKPFEYCSRISFNWHIDQL